MEHYLQIFLHGYPALGFKKIAYALPFVHAVEMERAVLNGNFEDIFPHLWWILGYVAVAFVAAVLLFLRQMKKQ